MEKIRKDLLISIISNDILIVALFKGFINYNLPIQKNKSYENIYFSKYYEQEALIADPVDGPIFASLLGKQIVA